MAKMAITKEISTLKRMLSFITIFASTALSLAQLTPPGGGSGSVWGGVPINVGAGWYAEALLEGMDVYRGWRVEYDGRDVPSTFTYDWASSTWRHDGYLLQDGPPSGAYGVANNATPNPHVVQAESEGIVRVKMQWTGFPTMPPPTVNLRLDGVSSYTYSVGGSGSANPGIGTSREVIEDLGRGVSGYALSKKIRTFPVSASGVVEFSYFATARSQANGIRSGCGANALWTTIALETRSASLRCTNHPGGYTKEMTGQTGVFEHAEWSGMKRFNYPIARQKPNPPSYTERGMVHSNDIGLRLFEADRAHRFIPLEQLTYIGSAGGGDGAFSYSIEGSVVQTGVSNAFNQWAIETMQFDIYNPCIYYSSGYDSKLGDSRAKFNSEEYFGFVDKSRTVAFSYSWDEDGYSADATVANSYKSPVERPENPFGSYQEEIEPDDIAAQSPPGFPIGNAFARHAGFDLCKFESGKNYAHYGSEVEFALFDPVNLTWESNYKPLAEKVKVATSAAGMIPKLKVAAAAVGVFADMYDKYFPKPTLLGITRKVEKFRKAYDLGMIEPVPDGRPSDSDMLYYDWRVWRRQLYKVKVYADNHYDVNGFIAQRLGFLYDPNTYDERQQFRRGSL